MEYAQMPAGIGILWQRCITLLKSRSISKMEKELVMMGSGFPEEWLSLRNHQEWHDWLANNHDQKDQIWLKIKKAHAARERFEGWPTDEKAHFLFWIAQAKRQDAREKRIAETLERAKAKRPSP